MKSKLYMLFLCLFSSFVHGQQDSTFLIKGRVVDAATQQAMEAVNIYSLTGLKGISTNEDGTFELQIESLPNQIQFSYIGYETLAIWIDNAGEQWLDIQLHQYYSTLPDVVVSAKPKIEEITHKEYTVRDFVFYENDILIMTYPGMTDGNMLVLIDIDGKAKDSLSLKGMKRIEFLSKSCLGNVHLVTETHDYQIGIDSTGINIHSTHNRNVYSRMLEPCVAATERHLYYRFRYCLGQVLKFEGFDRESEHQFTISEISGDENAERRYEEELAAEVGYIDYLDLSWEEKQMVLQRHLQGNAKLANLIHLFYQPIYVPMINLGSQLCIFNHVNDVLELYDSNGSFQRKVPINYHKIEKWDTRILYDKFTENVYTIFDHPKGKVIRELDTENGTLGSPVLIDCAFIEKIKVRDGVLFYLESGASLEAANRILHKVKI